jgi:hypothetical protein
MIKNLKISGFVGFLLMSAFSNAASASNLNVNIAFSPTAGNQFAFGYFTYNTGNNQVASFDELFTQMSFNGGPATTLSGVTLEYTAGSNALTLVATQTLTGIFSNIVASTTLETFSLSGPITQSGGTLAAPGITLTAVNANLLSDLHVEAYSTATTSNLSNALYSTGTAGSPSSGDITPVSQGLTIEATTPEPATFLLLGSGMAAAILVRKRKFLSRK